MSRCTAAGEKKLMTPHVRSCCVNYVDHGLELYTGTARPGNFDLSLQKLLESSFAKKLYMTAFSLVRGEGPFRS